MIQSCMVTLVIDLGVSVETGGDVSVCVCASLPWVGVGQLREWVAGGPTQGVGCW